MATKTYPAQEKLERRILHGLACEWEAMRNTLEPAFQNLLRKPLFSLRDLKTIWGYWSKDRKEICLSRSLVFNYPWDSVRDVLYHEMAHQLSVQVLGDSQSPPHGPYFKKACNLLHIQPMTSARYVPLHDRLLRASASNRDRIMIRVKKLLALAGSNNRHEAQTAMMKAHQLIAKYNITLLEKDGNRNFVSIFVGKSALRHPRENYFLANLLCDYYFVQGLWVSAYVLEKGKMGRVLEISGTPENIAIAGYVHDFIQQYISGQWLAYNKKKRLNRYRRTDFAVGVIEGFRRKLKSQMNNTSRSRPDSRLALIKRPDPLLEQYFAYRYPHTVTVKKSASSVDKAVLRDGKKIGTKMVIAKAITEKESTKIRYLNYFPSSSKD
jgi:hypothetical protein